MASRRKALITLLSAPFLLAVGAQEAEAAQHKVRIQSMRFSPSTLKVKVGDTVVFENRDSLDHTATALDDSWDTGNLGSRKSGAITFATKGEFKYFCRWHKGMRGKIIVG